MPLGVERSSQSNALTPPNSFLLWQILPPASGNGLICRENPIKGNMIVFMEIISNLYSHAQPQSGSTQSVRRSGRTRQFHRGGKRTEPDAARGDASGPGTGAALPGGPGGAFRQAGLPDGSRREVDRTCSESFGGRFAHAGDDAQIRRWVARPGTRRHEYDRAHVLAAADPTPAQDRSSPTGNQSQGRFDDNNAANAKDQRARPGSVRASDRRSGVRDGPAVQGRARRHSAGRARACSQDGDPGFSFPLSAGPWKREFGAASNDNGLAGARGSAAEAIDGI